MTRQEDVALAAELGASYVGFIFAGGPRAITPARARALKGDAPQGVKFVGVFGAAREPDSPGHVARSVGLDVVQLHGDPAPEAVEQVRESFDGEVWAALRVAESLPLERARALFACADAVVLDAYSQTALGGTGVALPWNELARGIATVRTGRLVLAGGLRAETVGSAVRALHPDVLDVSSGVESAPGIKDPAKLRAFRDAVVAAGQTA
jgi:phosphoribosylanthranilate isomerase